MKNLLTFQRVGIISVLINSIETDAFMLRCTKILMALAFIGTVFSSHAKDGQISFKGTLTEYGSGNKLNGATVSIYRNGSKIKDISVNNGSYNFQGETGFKYQLKFSKSGFAPKKIDIDTKKAIDSKDRFQMDVDIALFNTVTCQDYSLLNDPIAKAVFNNASGNIEWNGAYGKSMKFKIDNLLKEAKKCVQDDKAKFEKLMQEGDALMVNADYDGAIQKFEAAEDIFPEDDTLVMKLTAARKQRDENTKKEVRKEYERIITVADKSFEAKNYEEAKNLYQRAVRISKDTYPKTKLAEIKRLMNPGKTPITTTSGPTVDMSGDAGRQNRAKSVDELKNDIYNTDQARMNDSKSVSDGWYEKFTDLGSYSGDDNSSNTREVEDVKISIENQTARSQEIAAQKQQTQLQVIDGLQKKETSDEPITSVREETSTRENRNGDVIETTLKRFITIDGKETEYKMVTTQWGVFYFKNSVSISEFVWDSEAEKKH
jgi:tetratricopeptide (TPR) repeat protein